MPFIEPFQLDQNALTARGLVGLWGPGSPSGTTLFDHAGRKKHGNWQGTGTHWGVDSRGWYTKYASATADLVSVTYDSTFDTDSITYAAWFYLTTLNAASAFTGIISRNNTNDAYNLDFANTPNTIRCYVRKDSWSFVESSAVNANQWYHVVLTHSNDTIEGYLDGQSFGTATLVDAITRTSSALHLGSYGATELDGYLSDVRIYNRALSPTEIQHIFQSTRREPYSDLLMPQRRVFKAAAGVAPTSVLQGPLVGPLGGAI